MNEDKTIDSSAGTTPTASDNAPTIKARDGIQLIRAAMDSRKVRGNPKDFVLLLRYNTIVDSHRAFTVEATLPEVLKPGMVVYTPDRNGKPRPVRIEAVGKPSTEGILNPNPNPGPPDPLDADTLAVTNGHSRWYIHRAEAAPTGIPNEPTLVHKRDLAGFLGEKLADMFWNKAAGMRRVAQAE